MRLESVFQDVHQNQLGAPQVQGEEFARARQAKTPWPKERGDDAETTFRQSYHPLLPLFELNPQRIDSRIHLSSRRIDGQHPMNCPFPLCPGPVVEQQLRVANQCPQRILHVLPVCDGYVRLICKYRETCNTGNELRVVGFCLVSTGNELV